MQKLVIHLIAGARPNFMKIAPLFHKLKKQNWCDIKIIHTGQHYDANMSDSFFQDLGLPMPDYNLGVGSGSHAQQTAGVMVAYEKLCEKYKPAWAIVVGDVNSTAACALVCAKLHIPVAHLEAGLRSYDKSMPEEINRMVTDRICDLLWTPSLDANENLINEGIDHSKIEFVGNIMIDSFELLRGKITSDTTRKHFNLYEGRYGVVTLHRPSNVDDKNTLSINMQQLTKVSERLPLIFPIHPRTKKQLNKFGLYKYLESCNSITLVDPLGYIQFMNLVISCALIITDSGGIQEESTYLGIPCLTLRENTERPITISLGTNELCEPGNLSKSANTVLNRDPGNYACPKFWDGKTAARVVNSLQKRITR